MKRKLLILVSFLFCCTCLFPGNIKNDEIMWKSAYNGQFSIVHKLVLSRKNSDINDELLMQFIMAYVHYRGGKLKEMERIFKGIDRYIEHVLIPKEK